MDARRRVTTATAGGAPRPPRAEGFFGLHF